MTSWGMGRSDIHHFQAWSQNFLCDLHTLFLIVARYKRSCGGLWAWGFVEVLNARNWVHDVCGEQSTCWPALGQWFEQEINTVDNPLTNLHFALVNGISFVVEMFYILIQLSCQSVSPCLLLGFCIRLKKKKGFANVLLSDFQFPFP